MVIWATLWVLLGVQRFSFSTEGKLFINWNYLGEDANASADGLSGVLVVSGDHDNSEHDQYWSCDTFI